jgi:hypothetical protein
MADGIPIPTNQLSTGVIFSRRNKKGITKIINEHKANGMPNLLTTKGVKTSHPNGTDKRGYNAHVIDRSIAKFTIRQVKIATRQAIE